MSHPRSPPPQTTSSTHLRAPELPTSSPSSPPPRLALTDPLLDSNKISSSPVQRSSLHSNLDPHSPNRQPKPGPLDDSAPSQHVEPDADSTGIMQHPLWAQRGSQRLSSQDMAEKHHSMDAQSYRPNNFRDKQTRRVRKDVGALFSLMMVAPFVGIAICLYALVTFILMSLAAPVILVISGAVALKNQYLSLLLPGLNLHYRMVYSSRRCRVGTAARSWPGSVSNLHSPTSSNCSVTDEKPSPTPSIGQLMTILLLSPLLILPIALVNFVIMFFWFMSAVTESAESSSSMDDGHMMAKRVRRFWIRWLSAELSSRGNHQKRKKRGRTTSHV